MKQKSTIDVIIPVYRPDEDFAKLLSMLSLQRIPVRRIILMITEDPRAEYPDFKAYENIECHTLNRKDFDHGGTRNRGVSLSDADYVLLMTQDAVPADGLLTEKLLDGFREDGVASVYACQLPKENCREIERFTRSFNYPAESAVKSAADLPRLGVKTYFCSNVCAMYDRKVMQELGGFTDHTIFNEDMIYACSVIKNGYRIAYSAEAKVYHSHNYSGREQLRRNFDLAVSQADHPEVFSGLSSEKEGKSLVKETVKHLFAAGKWYLVPYLVYQSGMKYTGYFLGKRYNKLPRRMVRRLSMNKAYWEE